MKTIRLLTFGLIICLSALPTSSAVFAKKKPYIKGTILAALRVRGSSKAEKNRKIIISVRSRGVSFQINDEVEQELLQAGATAELIKVLRDKYHPPANRPPSISPAISLSIIDFEPISGSTDGRQIVTINGKGFVQGSRVKFGGVSATAISVENNGTLIKATTPAHAPGAVSVVLITPDGKTVKLDSDYTYMPALRLNRIDPRKGPADKDTKVKIYGSGFTEDTEVFFDEERAQLESQDTKVIEAITPAHKPGAVRVTVKNPDGQTQSKANAFTYEEPIPPPQKLIESVEITFYTQNNSKDASDSVEAWIMLNEEVVARLGPVGGGVKWDNNIPVPMAPLTLQRPVPLDQCKNMKLRFRKQPTAEKWDVTLGVEATLNDKSKITLLTNTRVHEVQGSNSDITEPLCSSR